MPNQPRTSLKTAFFPRSNGYCVTISSQIMIVAATFWSSTAAILQILGSLGVFLFGMKVMSEGVQKVAGDRMRGALAGMTGNRFKGVITGLFATILVQSSSATTVLVVSFVNAGLLNLVQSIGVIMGANLGTTTTAWIVALIGKFDVATIALPIMGIGLPLFFISREKLRHWGESLLGFGLVFLGLGLLKDSVPDLRTLIATDPATAEMIRSIVTSINGHGFGTVLMFLAAGLLLTLTVQSSSAAMAITITCALNGWLGDVEANALGVFQNSAAVVLGENIGTTVTAWLASLGANTAAKRAARAHLTFNVIGVVWCLAIYYPATSFVWWVVGRLPDGLRAANQALAQSEIAFGTAIFHSAFNLINICLLVAFVPQIARLVTWWVKEPAGGDQPAKLRFISSSLVDIGELSLAEADSAVRAMSKVTSDMYDGLVSVMDQPQVDLPSRIAELKRMEKTSDEMLHDITSYLIHCSTHELGTGNAARITAMLRVVNELETATDRIHRLVKLIQRKHEKSQEFSPVHRKELQAISMQVRALLDMACNATSGVDGTALEQAHKIEDRVDKLRKVHSKAAAIRMQQGADVLTEMLFIDLNNHFEAVANHALNIVQANRA
jgi:phosphate:Na+ symporter